MTMLLLPLPGLPAGKQAKAARLDITGSRDPMSFQSLQSLAMDRISFRQELFTDLRARMSRYPHIQDGDRRKLISRMDNIETALESSKQNIRRVESVNALRSEIFGSEGGVTRFYSQVPIEHGLFINFQLRYLYDLQQTTLDRFNETLIRIEASGNDVATLNQLKSDIEALMQQLDQQTTLLGESIEDNNNSALTRQLTGAKQVVLRLRGAWADIKTELQNFL